GVYLMNSNRLNIHLVTRIAVQAAVVLALVAPRTISAHANSVDSRSSLKNYQHVFIIMMENTGYKSLIGNRNAPWINPAAATYGLATNYYGVSHPSQPNYIAATSGSTNGVGD